MCSQITCSWAHVTCIAKQWWQHQHKKHNHIERKYYDGVDGLGLGLGRCAWAWKVLVGHDPPYKHRELKDKGQKCQIKSASKRDFIPW